MGRGIIEALVSNPVQAIIAEFPAYRLNGRTDLSLSRGALGQHYFELENTGNVALNFRPEIDRSGEANMLSSGVLHVDANANGRIDATEVPLPSGAMITVAPGTTLQLIYSFDVSAAANNGDVARTVLNANASSVLSGAQASGQISTLGVVTVGTAAVALEKTLEQRKAPLVDYLTYTLRLRNNSNAAVQPYDRIEGAPLLVDGAPRTGLLVRDGVPLHTRFTRMIDSGGMTALYHLSGSPDHSYVTRAPQDRDKIDAVAFLHDGAYPVGRSTDLRFTVEVDHTRGNVSVRNTAWAYLPNGASTTRIASNPVIYDHQTPLRPTLEFVDPLTGAPLSATPPTGDIGVTVTAGACNLSSAIDTIDVMVQSALTGDVEAVPARETGPNSGRFSIAPLPVAQMRTVVSGDGVLGVTQGDRIAAEVRCGGLQVSGALAVQPGGFVFNSVTDAPIANVEVALLDSTGRDVAVATTDNTGFYQLTPVAAGQYRLSVRRLSGFDFPSLRQVFLGRSRVVVGGASRGQAFSHAGGALPQIDLPVDPSYGVPLALAKTADRSTVRTGQYVTYKIKLLNNMAQALDGVAVVDTFPEGAILVPGTVRYEGRSVADPTANGADHRFTLPDMAPLSQTVLKYVLRFTGRTREGVTYNSAILEGRQMGTGRAMRSGIARAAVRLDNSGGVFSRKASIIGTVFMDCNGNGMQDTLEEPGVPGVKIVTQEGLLVVTDEDGRYSLGNLRPVTHVLSLQRTTLPRGAAPVILRAADMSLSGTRLVPLKRGELRSENFALEGCAVATLEEVDHRARQIAGGSAPGDRLGELGFGTAGDAATARSEAGLPTSSQIATGAAAIGGAPGAEGETEQVRKPLEELIKSLTATPEFLGLKDGMTVRRQSLTIRVKGPADLTLKLSVNGRALGRDRVGELSTWQKGNVQAAEFVAVNLMPGENRLSLTGADGFGIERMRKDITVIAPGRPQRIQIAAPAEATAESATPVPLVVRIVDRAGRPVQASGIVTLSARLGKWDVKDIRPDTPGLQAYIDNGEAVFDLMPPQTTGTELITVQSGFGTAEAEIQFVPDLNERILVGVVEGAVRLDDGELSLEGGDLSAFEETTAGVRGELYLKGRIRGDALLTLRYSSDRDTEDRLFRDVRSDDYYPVYGDRSERGFDAQSSTDLYVKIERGKSYVLYGDIAIEPEAEALRLGGLRTVSTGVKAQWRADRVAVTVFAARTAQQDREVEFAGRGISGPYPIDLSAFREGSDRVEILVRDRDTGKILSSTQMRRLNDYVLDYFANTLIFNAPVRQADRDGNPVSIRVRFQQTAANAERYWLYGGEARYEVNDRTSVGARVVRSDGAALSDQRYQIHSAYIASDLTDKTSIEAEVAGAFNGAGESGRSARVKLRHQGERARLELEAVHTDRGFAPPGSAYRPGLDLLSLEYDYRRENEETVGLSASYVADKPAGTKELTGEIEYTRPVSEELKSTVGLRLRQDLGDRGRGTDVAMTFGAILSPRSWPGLTIRTRIDQPIMGVGQGVLRFDGEYEVREGLTYFADIELELGEDGRVSDATRSRLGVDYRLADWVESRTEFKGDHAGEDRSAVSQRFAGQAQLRPGVTLRYAAEHTEPVVGDASRLTALALGAGWESEGGDWIADADAEHTWEEQGNTFYVNLGLAGQLNDDLTLLARSRLALDARGDEAERLRHRLRFGLAYRPLRDPRLNVLAWYEHNLEQADQRSEDHIWSLAATWDVTPSLQLRGKYAGQISTYSERSSGKAGGFKGRSTTQLVQGGATFDLLPKRLQLALNVMRMWDDTGAATNALGAEAGFVLGKGTMISLGYNHAQDGFAITPTLYKDGFYVRLRMLLDGSLWDRLDGFLE
ncbi:carboxypeptidase regulatory-like domain-containing protein [Brevirhabdus sp.]|uniref:carboxypeptidase regulatory-like domain-containing protein n=1 Tax=Brevirhabdus sp. TaxID=2004514 RepID=UPI004058DD6A